MLLASVALVLAVACGGSGAPPSRLVFRFDSFGNRDIYTSDVRGSGFTYLTAILPWEAFPVWSPDGTRIAYYAFSERTRDIYVAEADGSGVVNLTDDATENALPAWSPDGSRIAFVSNRDFNSEI